jgi:acetoin utilization protein AcuC
VQSSIDATEPAAQRHDADDRDAGEDDRRGGEMTQAALIWDPRLAAYDLGDRHPLNPVRLVLTVELMEALGLLGEGTVLAPSEASEEDLLLVHSAGYIEAVRHAGDWGSDFSPQMGLGTDDNPVFPGMHEIAALTCGASVLAIDEVLEGRRRRTFSIAGGMHHAHRARAAGFSIYNDAAVGIAVARRKRPELRVLYLDVDAHHGDGVQEAFAATDQVLSVSIHQTGVEAFPGTGFAGEIGYGCGTGFSANVPLPSFATDECFELAFDDVVAPLARAFGPDVIVAQLGVDAHYADPQTDLGLTLPGHRSLVRRTIALADEVCGGRLVALGGGGYHVAEVVPLAWAWAFAELGGARLGDDVPEAWRDHARSVLGVEPPRSMGAKDSYAPPRSADELLGVTRAAIRQTREAVFPYHGLQP